MVMPKANNDHFSVKNTKFSSKEFIWPYSHKTHGLDQNCTNLVYFQVSGTHSHAPTDEESSASGISAKPQHLHIADPLNIYKPEF